MERWFTKLILLGLVLLVTAVGLSFYQSWHHKLNSYIGVSPLTKALTIEFDPSQRPHADNFMHEDDAILVLHGDTAADQHQNDAIISEDMLIALDQSADKIIDKREPIFAKLEIMTLVKTPNGLKAVYLPLAKTDIKVIFLDKKYHPINRNQASKMVNLAGVAITSDDSKYLLYSVYIDASKFKK